MAAASIFLAFGAGAADHGDSAALVGIPRHDARLTGLHVFTRGDDLVLILGSDPTAPRGTTYVYPDDLTLRIFLDNDTPVVADGLLPFGGRVLDPAGIKSDVTFVITFRRGHPRLEIRGGHVGRRHAGGSHVQFFAGLRDDPFIRTPRHGKNVAAVVIQLPLHKVVHDQSSLLLWAASEVPDFQGPQADLAGRALRSQFPVSAAKTGEVMDNPLNILHPAEHFDLLATEPDVVIFDTALPADFPNGRELTDDVIRELGLDLPGEDPTNSENDVPFLDVFPYLAPPHE
jgi:hypothetical protein